MRPGRSQSTLLRELLGLPVPTVGMPLQVPQPCRLSCGPSLATSPPHLALDLAAQLLDLRVLARQHGVAPRRIAALLAHHLGTLPSYGLLDG